MQIIPCSDVDISSIVDALEAGQTLVYPTETCYGLGCDATNQKAVDRIFQIKERQTEKSVLVVMSSIEMAMEYVVWNDQIAHLAETYWPGPLTIVGDAIPGTELAMGVVADDGSIGFRISSHPLVQEILDVLGVPMVSTSANISGQKSPYDIDDIITMFQQRPVQPDSIIDAGTLPEQSPSTIIRIKNGMVNVLRQGSLRVV
jgi:L-threonylcarbamoyladenylate synthase